MINKYKIEELEKLINASVELNGQEYKHYIIPEHLSDLLYGSSTAFFVFIDLSKMKYQYVSDNIKNVLGFDSSEFMKYGVSFILNLYHPDVILTQKAIHEEARKYLRKLPAKEVIKYKFCYDYRVMNANGHYVRLLQHNRFLMFDKSGNPTLMLAICHDITNYRQDIKQTLVISKCTNDKEIVVLRKDFFPEYENGVLTKKEIEVWKLVCDGLQSKHIAEKMNISLNTVLTHRKRIYKKLREYELQRGISN